MDSITQITLGAAVGEAAAGRQAGRSAPLWGAAVGTLPDLDVLANPFLTEAQALLFHRGPTHSLLFAAVMAPLLGWGLARFHAGLPSMRRWSALVAAVILTHIGLDCLTSYGTQVFWPFSRHPVIGGTIFIIDPLYTVPLATGLLLSLRWSATDRPRRLSNYAGLALSSAYLLLTVANKLHVQEVFTETLSAQSLPTERVFTKPTPFNNLLWTAISEGDDGFFVGYYSLLDDDTKVDFRYVPKRHALLGADAGHPIVRRVRWFSRGYFAARQSDGDSLQLVDLRFGRNDLGLTDSGKYIFTFRLLTDDTGRIVGLRQERPKVRLSAALLRRFAARIRGQEEVVVASSPDRKELTPAAGKRLGPLR